MTETATEGAQVEMRYSLILDNGFVVDSTEDETVTLTLGSGEILPGLEAYLIGLQPGDRREFAIEPGTVFPWRDQAAIQPMPKSQFPEATELAPGQVYEFTSPGGDVVPGRIEMIEDDAVTVDFNHPLAGQAFTFAVEVVAVRPAD